LTLRERQQLPALLASLDRDGDGTVAAAELPIPIRFAVTRGPNVHRLLAKPSTTTRGLASPTAAELPDWFLAMDANRDRDLSRSEFLGTAEQFGQFDADSDGLLSVNEALKMMPGD
jgi:Ca2+-binding EF-hand superfamily protein